MKVSLDRRNVHIDIGVFTCFFEGNLGTKHGREDQAKETIPGAYSRNVRC